MRFPLVAALALIALPLHADTVLRGSYMLGTYIWPETELPRYARLGIYYGDDVRLELSYALPLDTHGCNMTLRCEYDVDVARARVNMEDGTFQLSEIDTGFYVSRFVWADGMLADEYAELLLGMIQDAPMTVTPHRVTFETAEGPVEFYEANSLAQDAIRAYPIAQGLWIGGMAFCEVRNIAPLFTRTDLSDAEETFRDALVGMAHQVSVEQQIDMINPSPIVDYPRDEARITALTQIRMLPDFLASGGHEIVYDGDVWDAAGSTLFQNDGDAVREALDVYGNTLGPLVSFLTYQLSIGADGQVDRPCDDLSLGFIAAQEGG